MKERFNQLISETVKPFLKLNGYSKKGLNFYSRKNDLIFMFNFQNSQGNSFDQTKFYINFGIHSTVIDKVIDGTELFEPKEYQCYFRDRVSTITKSENDGYFIKSDTNLKALGSKIITDLKTAIDTLEPITSTSDLIDLMIQRNGANDYRALFEFLLLTNQTAKLKNYVKKLFQTFGKEKRWTILESNLTDTLKEHKQQETLADILSEE